MRTRLGSKFTLFFFTFAVAMLVFPAMAFAQTTSPTIQSDQADYAPGSTVNLSGSGWQSGESVHVVVNDTYGATWQHTADVTADANGNVTDSFNLPNSFVSDYDVTATGAQSGTATTTFTDAAINVNVALGSDNNSPNAGDPVKFTTTVTNKADGSAITEGDVTFSYSTGNNCNNGTTIGSPNIALNTTNKGVVSVTTSSLPSGSLTVCANYKGTGGSNGTTSGSAQLTQVVKAGPAAQLAFTTQPSNTDADASISPSPEVTLEDQYGTPVQPTDPKANANVTIAIGNNPAGGTLSGTKTVQAVGGVATFSGLSIDNPNSSGSYTLAASSTGLTGATSGTFSITKHPTTTSVSCFPNPTNLNRTTKCTVTVTDNSTGTKSTPTGQVTWSRSGTGNFGGTSTTASCNLSGSGDSATCDVNYTPTSGTSQSVTANYQGDPTHATSNGSRSLTINSLQATTLTVSPQTATAGDATTLLTATLKNASNQPVSGKSVSFKLNNNSVGSATTNSSGVATVNASLSGFAAGSYPIDATFTGDSGSGATYNGSAGSGTLTVNPADNTPPSVAITSPTTGDTTTNGSINVSGTASDASGIQGVTVNNNAATLGTGNSWSYSNLPLQCGQNTITAEATDNSANHNKGQASITVTRNCDTTPPTVSSIARTPASASQATNASSVNWLVTFSENVSGVDAGDFQTANPGGGLTGTSVTGVTQNSGSTYTVGANTGSGSGTLRLDAVDDDSIADGAGNKLGGTGAGNGNFTSGETYTIDRTGPSVTLTDVNGSARTFPYVTNQTVSSVGGSCENGGSNVTVKIDGTADTATAPCSSGSWSLNLTNARSNDGTYGFVAFQSDALGNPGDSGASKSVQVDKTAPTVTPSAKLLDGGTVLGDYTAGTWTNKSVRVTFACADNTNGSGLSAASGPQTLPDFTANTSGATATFSGTCADKAGNTATSALSFGPIKIDKDAPTLTPTAVQGDASANFAGATPYTAGTWTNQDVKVTFACADVGPSGRTSASGDQDKTFTAETSGATATFDGTCADEAGNTAAASNFGPIKIDKTPIPSRASVDSNYSNSSPITVHFNTTPAANELSGLKKVELWAKGPGASASYQLAATNTTTASGDFSYDATQGDGDYSFYTIAEDNAGNREAIPATGADAIVTVTHDTQPPTSSASATVPNGTGTSPYNSGTFTNKDVTVSLSADDGSGSGVKNITYSASGAQTIAQATQAGNSVTLPAISAEGTTTVSYHATDNANNPETPEKTFTVKIDKTPPQLTLPGTITKEATGPTGAAVSFNASATDALDASPQVSCSKNSGATFALGTTTVNCSATDQAGNTASGSFDVTVSDTTGPVISGTPSNITKEATGAAGATVSWTAPTANDAVDGSVSVVCQSASGLKSGDTFPFGTTSVTCTATDAHNNKSTTNFDVTVQDKTAPQLTLPGDITKLATANSGAPVTYTASANDAVDGTVQVNCIPASGSTFQVGTTTVDCSATDSHNNKATGSFKVTVNYNWTGFFSPVDNPDVVNSAKAGSTIPVKFSLGGNQGLNIFYVATANDAYQGTYPSVGSLTAGAVSGDPTDAIEEYSTATVSGLKYDSTANQYIYNWKTDSKWAGSYKQLIIRLADGTYHRANFYFTK